MPHSGALCVYLLTLLSPAVALAGHVEVEVEVEVLVFLPQNNSYPFSRARVAPAILYAQRRLPALRFHVRFEDSDCVNGAVFALVERSCAHDKPDLILGPVCEYEAAAVVRLASRWDIPVISAGALAAGFGDKRGEYSQLTRIAPPYVKMAETFAAMFAHFTWRSALLVYEDDKEERNCYFTLEGIYHLMADFNIRTYAFAQEERVDTDDLLQGVQDSEGTENMVTVESSPRNVNSTSLRLHQLSI